MVYKCFVFTGLNAAQQTRGVQQVLARCQHWTSIRSTSCLLGVLTSVLHQNGIINFAWYIVSTVYSSHLLTLLLLVEPLTLHLLVINLYGYAAGGETSPVFCSQKNYTLLVSDDLHIGIMFSWPMTLKVDFLQFEGHLPVIEVKTQNAGYGHTHQHHFQSIERFWLNYTK